MGGGGGGGQGRVCRGVGGEEGRGGRAEEVRKLMLTLKLTLLFPMASLLWLSLACRCVLTRGMEAVNCL